MRNTHTHTQANGFCVLSCLTLQDRMVAGPYNWQLADSRCPDIGEMPV